MGWMTSIGVALLSGLLGLVGGGVLGQACVRWYRISSFEGNSGYYVLGMILLGGVVGFIGGLIVARWAGPGFLKELGAAVGCLLALTGVVAALCWALADVEPTINGHELMMQVEIRLPSTITGKPSTNIGPASLQLGSLSGTTQRRSADGELRVDEARREGNRWIIPGEVPLFTHRGKRMLTFRVNGDANTMGFFVPVPGHPGKKFLEWSDWLPQPPPGSPAWPEDRPSYRFRLTEILPPPPGPTEEERNAAVAAEELAQFQALSPTAPIAGWIAYTRYGVPEDRKAAAIRAIRQRPDFEAAWKAVATGADGELAGELLGLVPEMDAPESGWTPLFQVVGRDIIDRIRRFNATSAADDPSFEGAADVSRRFSPWLESIRLLRDTQDLQLTPELTTILELSRARPESICMRQDVCRVASYYLKEWAGVEPLPTDPKPR